MLTLVLCFDAQAGNVLFDLSKFQTAGNADWKIDDQWPFPGPAQPTSSESWNGALSSWGYALHRDGFVVASLPPGAMVTFGTQSPFDLNKVNVFIIPEPQAPYSTGEKLAILRFVQSGGGLFMIADHYRSDRNNNGWDSVLVFNDLGSEELFGIRFDDGPSLSSWFNEVVTNMLDDFDAIIIDGPYGSVESIGMYGATELRLNPLKNPSVQGLAWRNRTTPDQGRVVLAAARLGMGKVVAQGDSSPTSDGSGDPTDRLYDGWNEGSSLQWHMNAIDWLMSEQTPLPRLTPSPTPTPRPQTPTATPTPLAVNLVMRQAFESDRVLRVHVDVSAPSGLQTPADLYVVLEVGGVFYFLPTVDAAPTSFRRFEAGLGFFERISVIELPLPNRLGTFLPLRWYSAVVESQQGTLLSNLAIVQSLIN